MLFTILNYNVIINYKVNYKVKDNLIRKYKVEKACNRESVEI